MRVYLFHAESNTFICEAKHYSTIATAAYKFVGVEFRFVSTDEVDKFDMAHLDLEFEIVKAPPWLRTQRILDRHQEVKDFVAAEDAQTDYKLFVEAIEESGLLMTDYPTVGNGVFNYVPLS